MREEILSTCTIVRLRINRLVDDFDYISELRSAKLASITNDFIQLTKDLMNRTLEDAHEQQDVVDEAVLLGGSMNLVPGQDALCEMFGADKINRGTNPATAVTISAAEYAYASSADFENV